MPLAPIALLSCTGSPLIIRFRTYPTIPTPRVRHLPLPSPTLSAGGLSTDALTAYGTVALAALTLLTLVTTVIVSRHGERQLRAEREEVQDQESLAEAYAVQVVGIATVIVINHGRYTISDIAARLRTRDSQAIEFEHSERIVRVSSEAAGLGADSALDADFQPDILTPWDAALRFSVDPAHINDLVGAYPIVRWSDRRNTRWEQRRGRIEKIDAQAPWPVD